MTIKLTDKDRVSLLHGMTITFSYIPKLVKGQVGLRLNHVKISLDKSVQPLYASGR